MKFNAYCKSAFVLFFVVCFAVADVAAQATAPQVPLPRPSQKAGLTQRVGVTDISITYSRPPVKGRAIWGDPTDAQIALVKDKGAATLDNQNTRPKDSPIVPYGHVWRAGANEATTFAVTDDVLINGQKLAAGTYSLHTIPDKTEWTIIFNSDAGQWGSFTYDEKKDVLRVKVKPQAVADNQEWLSYTIPTVGPTTADVLLRWEKMAVPFTVEIPNVEAAMVARAEKLQAANPTEWAISLQIANQFAGDKAWDKAIVWADKSIAIKETFRNLSTKAQILDRAGKKTDAIAVGEKAVTQGKADKVDTTKFEAYLNGLKTAKS